MKEQDFRAWLEARRWQGSPLTLKARDNRVRRLKRVERSLAALGFQADSIDDVIGQGLLESLLTKLHSLIGAADRPPVSLVPQATNPDGQLRNLIAVVRLYRKFAAGEDPNAHDPETADAGDDAGDSESDADDIRAAALRLYIEPARQRGDSQAVIRAGDLHDVLGLNQAHANVCQAISGAKFQRLAEVPPPRAEGPGQSSSTTFHYQLAAGAAAEATAPAVTPPTNIIFYGPPGTGKTYRTASEAVRLCDSVVPDDRTELMRRYRELEREGRVGFVTFHQSFSYEDFVEGLRPETGRAESGSDAGFRLEPRKGVFREMAALAAQARKAAAGPQRNGAIDLAGRTFWKMGLGAIGTEDYVYRNAIAGDYVVLGWGGDVDWSDPVYEDLTAVREKWAEVGSEDKRPSHVSQLWPFRSHMKKGDIVIVPYGNTAFRAIGEVTGDYAYIPNDEGGYNHRRSVNWLLVLDDPLPLDTIVDGAFTMRTLYAIEPHRIRLEALNRLVGGDGASEAPGVPQSFVLVIDEINRANISKVFGELITLLEADKRLGMTNELTVKLPYSGDTFGVPANLHLIGTMNTADRSIALLDTALRRRFTFEELMPEPALLAAASARTQVDLITVLATLNARIEYLFDREHQIGHAFFMDCEDREDVDEVMRHRVIPLLQEYFFEDWSRVAVVLGEREGVRDGAFLRSERIAPPPGFEGEDRWRWSLRETFAPDAYERLADRRPAANDAVAEAASAAAE